MLGEVRVHDVHRQHHIFVVQQKERRQTAALLLALAQVSASV